MNTELLEEEIEQNWIIPNILENILSDNSYSEGRNSYLVSFSGSNVYSGYSNQVFPPVNLTTQIHIHNFRAFDSYFDNNSSNHKNIDSGTMFLGPAESRLQYSPFIIDGIVRALSVHAYHLSSTPSLPYIDQALDCLGIKQRIIKDYCNNDKNDFSSTLSGSLLSSFPSDDSFIRIRVGPAEISKDIGIKALMGGALNVVPLTAGSRDITTRDSCSYRCCIIT